MTEENVDRWPWNYKPVPEQGPRPGWWRPLARKRWDRREFVNSLLRIPHVSDFDAVVESYGGLEATREAMPESLRPYLAPLAEYMDEKRAQLEGEQP